MGIFDEKSRQFLLSSSSENPDFENSSSSRDEEFYEEIEAPKFVDFNSPHHFRPDDRYWFCQRVGCDQKHGEEINSETVYKNFVLRVMAARSPNLRIRKALDRNASRTPIKYPYSAPPKSSRPRLSRLDVISSISQKMDVEKRRVIRSLLKPEPSTPVTKAKPVASKYLTTPRNKKCPPKTSPFRSVQNLKHSTSNEVSKTISITKALVFRSPKKVMKVKACVEMHTPTTNLCEGMSKLDISSQRKRVLGYSSSLSSRKLNSNPSAGTKLLKSSNTAPIDKSSRPTQTNKLLRIDGKNSSLTNEGPTDIKQELTANNATEEKLHNSISEDASASSTESQLLKDSDSGLADVSITNKQLSDHEESNVNNDGRKERDLKGNDDKENAAVSDQNRMCDINYKGNERKIFGKVKKVIQTPDKHLKGGALSSPAPHVPVKFKKPKPTNPKPFRLLTDERGILKETKLEESRTNHQSETSNWSSSVDQKLHGKQKNNSEAATSLKGERTPKGKNTAKLEAIITPQSPNGCKLGQQKLTPQSPNGCKLGQQKHANNSIQKIDKTRKIASPLKKQYSVQPQEGAVSSNNKEVISYLIPGQKLDVIHEISPQVSELKKPRKRPVTVPVKPKFHNNAHVPRSCCCTNKLK